MEIKEIEGWVEEEMSELFWKFRDDVDDEEYFSPLLLMMMKGGC